MDLGVKCFGCNETDHEINNCPRLHLMINK